MLATLTALLISGANAASQIATFNVGGVGGHVQVSNGWVDAHIDVDKVETSLIPGGTECFANGFFYHIHDSWQYNDTLSRIYTNAETNACGPSWTGGHWDPWHACGHATGNEYCQVRQGPHSCLPGSSVLGPDSEYSCDHETTPFKDNPYVCEVGDWSGKYGIFTDYNHIGASFWEVSERDLDGLSVVFHCSTDGQPRAFCAPFERDDDTMPASDISMQGMVDVAAYFDEYLTGDSRIELNTDGIVYIHLDSTDQQDDVNDLGCDVMDYTIFETWNNNDQQLYLDECTEAVLGKQWDPTAQCTPFSGNMYCNEGKLCNDTAYEYNCQFDEARFSCAPGDLSGKFGTFAPIESPFITGYSQESSLSPPTDMIMGKSIAVHCTDGRMFACSKIVVNGAYGYNIFCLCLIIIMHAICYMF